MTSVNKVHILSNSIEAPEESVVFGGSAFKVRVELDDPTPQRANFTSDADFEEALEERDLLIEETDFIRPMNWCSSAGVSVSDDAVQVDVDVRDAKEMLRMTVSRDADGRVLLSVPTEANAAPKLKPVGDGTYEVCLE